MKRWRCCAAGCWWGESLGARGTVRNCGGECSARQRPPLQPLGGADRHAGCATRTLGAWRPGGYGPGPGTLPRICHAHGTTASLGPAACRMAKDRRGGVPRLSRGWQPDPALDRPTVGDCASSRRGSCGFSINRCSSEPGCRRIMRQKANLAWPGGRPSQSVYREQIANGCAANLHHLALEQEIALR